MQRSKRKEIKKLISQGLVYVNEERVKKSESKYDETNISVKINGEEIEIKTHIYLLLNKPKGYVSTTEIKCEKTVLDLVPEKYKNRNLFPAGRLDKDTEGLMLLTNNGKYAHFLTSPNHHVEKKYYVELENEIKDEDINLFCNGLEIRDGKDELYITKQAKFDKLTSNSCYVYITEGKFHQIKRMFEKLNNKVIYLKRVQFGDIKLDETLQLGEYRELTEEEIILFKQGK